MIILIIRKHKAIQHSDIALQIIRDALLQKRWCH